MYRSPNIIRMIKSRRLRWTGLIARMEEGRSAFKILTGKPTGLGEELVRCYVWSITLYGSETWTLRKLERKYLETFEIWCLRRMKKVKWSEKVTNEEIRLSINIRKKYTFSTSPWTC